jgi:hypothetical protein
MTFDDLDAFDQYYLEVAKKELAKAVASQTNGRRALGQQQLRECLLFYTKLPREFTDEAFKQEYDRTYSLLYRGY